MESAQTASAAEAVSTQSAAPAGMKKQPTRKQATTKTAPTKTTKKSAGTDKPEAKQSNAELEKSETTDVTPAPTDQAKKPKSSGKKRRGIRLKDI
jgi:hypothetical protein